MELEEDDAAATARRRPPRLFKIKLRRVGQDIVMEELVQFLNARATLTNNCQMGKFFFFFLLIFNKMIS